MGRPPYQRLGVLTKLLSKHFSNSKLRTFSTATREVLIANRINGENISRIIRFASSLKSFV